MVTIATIAGFGVLPALAALGAWRAGWQPTGDVAIIGLRSRDAWTLHPPLVGQPTTGSSYAGISSFHPGPAEFWLLGPWVRLFGPALGMLLGTAAINGAALAGVMWTAFRRGGPVLLGFVALGVAALVRSVGAGTLYDPFNSEIATYALLLTVLAAWSVAAGDRRLLPMLAAAASLAAQTHVSGAVAVAPVVGLTVGVLVVQVRAGRWSPAREQRWLGGAAAVLAVAWLPVLVREVTGPSNLWALWRTSRAPHPQIGLAFAVERLLGSLALPPLFVWTPPDLVFVGTASTAGILVAALVAGGTAALVLVLQPNRGVGERGSSPRAWGSWPSPRSDHRVGPAVQRHPQRRHARHVGGEPARVAHRGVGGVAAARRRATSSGGTVRAPRGRRPRPRARRGGPRHHPPRGPARRPRDVGGRPRERPGHPQRARRQLPGDARRRDGGVHRRPRRRPAARGRRADGAVRPGSLRRGVRRPPHPRGPEARRPPAHHHRGQPAAQGGRAPRGRAPLPAPSTDSIYVFLAP
ncbi:MAG: hypothetical protein R2746_10105 [Acidimicrobiales bacterium]